MFKYIDKTNDLCFELYTFHAKVEGTGYPLSYLLLENNGNCKDGVRTSIIQAFLTQMRNIGLLPNFFLSDKDFAQLSAASFVWPETKIQICKWHMKKALMERLRSNKSSRHSSFNPLSPEGKQFPFDNIIPSPIFCPKELQITVWNSICTNIHISQQQMVNFYCSRDL